MNFQLSVLSHFDKIGILIFVSAYGSNMGAKMNVLKNFMEYPIVNHIRKEYAHDKAT
jgi:hypothetical protein